MKEKALYFVQCGDAVKIGVANNPQKRLRTLQVGMPTALKVLAILDGLGGWEKEVHRQLAHLRLRGEWFKVHPDIEAMITQLRSWPIESLPHSPATQEIFSLSGPYPVRWLARHRRYGSYRPLWTYRRERGWSVTELASRLDMSVSRTWYWCNGQSMPDGWALQRLCEVFGVDVAEIDLSIYRKDKAAV